MATRKRLSVICKIPKFANAYLGKVTKFQGYSLFRFGVLSNLLAWRWKRPPPKKKKIWIGLSPNSRLSQKNWLWCQCYSSQKKKHFLSYKVANNNCLGGSFQVLIFDSKLESDPKPAKEALGKLKSPLKLLITSFHNGQQLAFLENQIIC